MNIKNLFYLILSGGIIFCINSCSIDSDNYISLNKDQCIIVRAKFFEDDRLSYGVFIIKEIGVQSNGNTPYIIYEYMYMNDGLSVIDVQDTKFKMGEEMTLQGYGGIDFFIFYYDWTYKDLNSIWIRNEKNNIVRDVDENKGMQRVVAEFCSYEANDIKKLIGINLSSCFNNNN